MLGSQNVSPILASMYDERAQCVPCFIGPPGIGKTQGVYRFAEEKGVKVVTFILSNTVPSEVSGIRMPDNENKKLEVFDDSRMASLEDGDILFFDEILEAPPMLWSAILTLIQDRVMASGRKLPDVMIVAASNKVAAPGIIPDSVRDRFIFFDVAFDWASWSIWFFEEFGIDPPKDLKKKLQSTSTTYNILTPRKFVKLYKWLKSCTAVDLQAHVIRYIEDAFDTEVATLVSQAVSTKQSPRRMIKNAVLEVDPDAELPEGFETLPLPQLLDLLQALPEWDSIQKELSNIEIE